MRLVPAMAVAIWTTNKIPTVVALLLLELMTSSPLPEGNAYGTRGMTPDRQPPTGVFRRKVSALRPRPRRRATTTSCCHRQSSHPLGTTTGVAGIGKTPRGFGLVRPAGSPPRSPHDVTTTHRLRF